MLLAAGTLGIATTIGCQSSDMDKDLKRQADRSTVELMKVEKERDALRDQVTKLQALQPTEAKVTRTEASGSTELAAARKQVADLETQLKQTRTALRDAQEQILNLKTSMPAPAIPTTPPMTPK